MIERRRITSSAAAMNALWLSSTSPTVAGNVAGNPSLSKSQIITIYRAFSGR